MHFNVMSWIRLVILSFEQASHILFIWFTRELDYKVNYAALTVLKITSILNIKDLIQSVCGICIWPGRKKITNLHKQQDKTISSSQLVKIETVNNFFNKGPKSRLFKGDLLIRADSPRKIWNFKALKSSVVGASWNITTVEPLVRGHLQDRGKCSLNRVIHWIEVRMGFVNN